MHTTQYNSIEFQRYNFHTCSDKSGLPSTVQGCTICGSKYRMYCSLCNEAVLANKITTNSSYIFGEVCENCYEKANPYAIWATHLQNKFNNKLEEVKNTCKRFIKESNE